MTKAADIYSQEMETVTNELPKLFLATTCFEEDANGGSEEFSI